MSEINYDGHCEILTIKCTLCPGEIFQKQHEYEQHLKQKHSLDKKCIKCDKIGNISHFILIHMILITRCIYCNKKPTFRYTPGKRNNNINHFFLNNCENLIKIQSIKENFINCNNIDIGMLHIIGSYIIMEIGSYIIKDIFRSKVFE